MEARTIEAFDNGVIILLNRFIARFIRQYYVFSLNYSRGFDRVLNFPRVYAFHVLIFFFFFFTSILLRDTPYIRLQPRSNEAL